jgi:ribosomal protein S18 acetylase RimI-like enzyme
MNASFSIHPVQSGDRKWMARFLAEYWDSPRVVSRGKIHLADQLPGYIALQQGERVGLVTYRIAASECEIVTLNALVQGIGIGSALIDAVKAEAIASNCRRLWLITSNDNTPAIRFYQRRGFHLVAVYPNAIEQSRKLKPEIPLIGMDNIPIRDEIEFEIMLESKNSY